MTDFDIARYEQLLGSRSIGRNLVYRQTVDTTMVVARELAASGAAHGTLVLAEEQTAGRGRRGRSFQSPAGENLYFTLVLRLDRAVVVRLPTAVPVSVCMAIEAEGVAARVKWPNDIWIDGRKACGMLIDLDETAGAFTAFPGIGINVNGDPTLIPELRETATSLRLAAGRPIEREPLLARLCGILEDALGSWSREELAEHYRARSLVIGQRVSITGATTLDGLAVDILDDGTLQLRLDNGALEIVNAGEVSLRPAP